MAKPRVLITRSDVPKIAIETLKERCELEISEKLLMSADDLKKKIKGKAGILCFPTDSITKEVIEASDELDVVSCASTDSKNVNQDICKEKNIISCHGNADDSHAVVEVTLSLLIMAGRHIFEGAQYVKEQKWLSDIKYQRPSNKFNGQGVYNSVIGIYGRGATSVGLIKGLIPLKPLQILYNDALHPFHDAENLGAVFVEFEQLIKESDFLVCMSKLTDENTGKFCKAVFEKMKKNAVFINTSRGGVVNQKDLHDALKNKTLRAAALDVTAPLPIPKDDPLISLPNIIITPHLGSSEINVRAELAKTAAENILHVLDEKKAKTVVKMTK